MGAGEGGRWFSWYVADRVCSRSARLRRVFEGVVRREAGALLVRVTLVPAVPP